MKTKLPKKYQALLSIKRPVLIECEDRFRILYPSGLSLYRNHSFIKAAVQEDFIQKSNEFYHYDKILHISCFVSEYMYNENDKYRFSIDARRNANELRKTVEAMYRHDKGYKVKILAVIDT